MKHPLLTALLVGASAVVLTSQCGTSEPRGVSELHPAIQSFLVVNLEFGVARSVTAMPDWAEGPRQQVETTTGTFLFYLDEGGIVTVYRQ